MLLTKSDTLSAEIIEPTNQQNVAGYDLLYDKKSLPNWEKEQGVQHYILPSFYRKTPICESNYLFSFRKISFLFDFWTWTALNWNVVILVLSSWKKISAK